MLNIKQSIIPAAFACLLLGSAAVPAMAYTTSYTTTTTTYGTPGYIGIMGMRHARAIALSVQPGRVHYAALVRGNYGQPVYVFDISRDGNLYGVAVNARSGAIVENVNQGVRVYEGNFWDRLFAPLQPTD